MNRKEEILFRVIASGTTGFTKLETLLSMNMATLIQKAKMVPKDEEYDIDDITLQISLSEDIVKDATDKIMKYCHGKLPETRDELFNAIKYGFFYQPKFNNVEIRQIKELLFERCGMNYSYEGGNMFSPIVPLELKDSLDIPKAYYINKMIYKSDDNYNGSNIEISINNKVMHLAI